MIYKDITILDKNLKPLDEIENTKNLEEFVNWAKKNNTKIISIVYLTRHSDVSKYNFDDIIKVKTATGIDKFGIWKVYGSVLKENPRDDAVNIEFQKALKRLNERTIAAKHDTFATDLIEEYKGYKIRKDVTIKKFQVYAVINRKVLRGGSVEILKRKIDREFPHIIQKNPRKKEMKMGTPDKTPAIKKIMDEIDEKPNEWRFRMQPPSKFHEDSIRYGKKLITNGVRAVYGCPKGSWATKNQYCKKGMVMQSLRLSRTVFKSKESAAKWIAKHTKPRRE